jgi:phage terminase large subunit-like protein
MTSPYRSELRDRATRNDAAFAEYVADLEFPPHLRELSRFADREASAVILAPRGHAKTTWLIHRLARQIGVSEGRQKFGILTATIDDARARSGAIRRVVESPRFAEVFPWARGGVIGSPWTDEAWTVRGVDLGKDHTLVAMSVGGVRAGPRLDLLVADDMVGMQENESETQREKALQTYRRVVAPMIVPTGRRLFVGTRWHEADIYATHIASGWPHLTLQAMRPDGSVLWPDYWTLERLEATRAELGTAVFNLQYQNDPSGMGGNVFKRDWFKHVDHVPAGARRVGMDLAASKGERNDYTAAVEWVEDSDHNLYLVGAYRARIDEGHRSWLTGLDDAGVPIDVGPAALGPRLLWPTNRLPVGFAGLSDGSPATRPLSVLNIEAVIFQSTFVREVLARTRLPALAVHPDKDKVTRARTLAARYGAGKVFHLRSAPGLAEIEQELVAFPNAVHDDLVDAAVYGADLNTASQFYFTAGRR